MVCEVRGEGDRPCVAALIDCHTLTAGLVASCLPSWVASDLPASRLSLLINSAVSVAPPSIHWLPIRSNVVTLAVQPTSEVVPLPTWMHTCRYAWTHVGIWTHAYACMHAADLGGGAPLPTYTLLGWGLGLDLGSYIPRYMSYAICHQVIQARSQRARAPLVVALPVSKTY